VSASRIHIFLGFIIPIFIALFICVEQPVMSFCDIEDFAVVISCIAIVLFSPSGIFITESSALAMLASEHPIDLDLADAGLTASVSARTASPKPVLEIMLFLEMLQSVLPPTAKNDPAQEQFRCQRFVGPNAPADSETSIKTLNRSIPQKVIMSKGVCPSYATGSRAPAPTKSMFVECSL
jgi:hypothetical protein